MGVADGQSISAVFRGGQPSQWTASLGEDTIKVDILGWELSIDKIQPKVKFFCSACISLKSGSLSISLSTIIPLIQCQFSFLKYA